MGPDTQTCESVVDKYVRCTVGCHKFTSEKKFKVLGCAMNRQGKTIEAIEERMQSANKAFWKDISFFWQASLYDRDGMRRITM